MCGRWPVRIALPSSSRQRPSRSSTGQWGSAWRSARPACNPPRSGLSDALLVCLRPPFMRRDRIQPACRSGAPSTERGSSMPCLQWRQGGLPTQHKRQPARLCIPAHATLQTEQPSTPPGSQGMRSLEVLHRCLDALAKPGPRVWPLKTLILKAAKLVLGAELLLSHIPGAGASSFCVQGRALSKLFAWAAIRQPGYRMRQWGRSSTSKTSGR